MTDAGLPTTELGRTGLRVTRIGYGAMSLDPARATPVTPQQAEAVLNAVLDAGINFIDTSPDYGPSEEYIGRFVGHRRSEFFIATKCGCPVAASAGADHAYTRENIEAAVEQSLRRLGTDYIDLLQVHGGLLHSPGGPLAEVLAREGAIETLRDLQRAGKVRFIGVSSTLPDLPAHIATGAYDAFQIPYSPVQRDHGPLVTQAAQSGAGTIIRGGAMRGAPSPEKDWSIRQLPEVEPERPRTLWEQAGMDDLLDGMSRMEFVLRYTFSHPDLHTAIVGTANVEHLRANIAAMQKGPLPADLLAEANRRLDAAEHG